MKKFTPLCLGLLTYSKLGDCVFMMAVRMSSACVVTLWGTETVAPTDSVIYLSLAE